MSDRRVAVIGLGVTGEAVARALRSSGDNVVVVEDTPRPDSEVYARRTRDLAALGVEVVEQPRTFELERLIAAQDLLVPSPGVREDHPIIRQAQRVGVPVRAEIDLAAELASSRGQVLVAVTGTNGKTTVTSLIAAMLDRSGVHAVAAGNIGRALIEAVATDAAVLVAEVSSFQLSFTSNAFRPRVAVLLNVAPDHIDWHGSFDRYSAAKARIFEHQGDDDLLVYDADDPVGHDLAQKAPARRVACSSVAAPGVYHEAGGMIVDDTGDEVAPLGDVALLAHDVANALAAAAAALDTGASRAGIERALRAFQRLPHRVAPVGDASGVRFFDDSKATNPHATLAALRAFDEPVVLIAGGHNKGLDLTALREESAGLRAVVAIGDASAEVEAVFSSAVDVARASSMHDAVVRAAQVARPGDVVLLSPACASFDWYPSGYAARGDDFVREVRKLEQAGAA
jgi:UDP-N-acetylmuramoylalanine--D-glutamate ligase